jgi:SAM-dependent methyltransferase
MTAYPTSYDEVPYPSRPMAQTHPDRLATLATLFGMSPAPVGRCRVLEIGCADAGNLLAMAEGLPGSAFVGIDPSRRHVGAGRAALAELGLANVELRRLGVEDAGDALGRFDYVVAHGVYSWVPRPAQEALLAACGRLLAPQGVALVSYNALPGWHARGAARDMMRFHTRHAPDPRARAAQARALLDFLADNVPAEQGSYGQMLRRERQALADKLDGYLLHDELEEVNEPLYFHGFLARAAGHGLQFLAEAEAGPVPAPRLPPAVLAALAGLGGDVVAREQYLDFLTNRTFRQTLLCHQDVALRREVKPEQVAGFQIASRAECLSPDPDVHSDKPEEFRGPTGVTVGTGHPLSKAAFLHLASVWPRCLSLDDLQAAARARLGDGAVRVRDAAAADRENALLAEDLLCCRPSPPTSWSCTPTPRAWRRSRASARGRPRTHATRPAGGRG